MKVLGCKGKSAARKNIFSHLLGFRIGNLGIEGHRSERCKLELNPVDCPKMEKLLSQSVLILVCLVGLALLPSSLAQV